MADPLSLLRLYNMTKKHVTESNGQILFGEFTWPKDVKTNYVMWGSGKDGAPKEYYTLECLVYILQNVNLIHSVYVREAAANNIPIVRRPDRKDLLAYLNGETETSPGIDKTTPLKIISKPLKRLMETALPESLTKTPRFDDDQTQAVKNELAAAQVVPLPRKKSRVVKSLAEAFSEEAIASIKVKRLAKKRSTIKENDETDSEHFLRDIVQLDVDNTNAIIARERVWRNRSTILQASGKPFTNIFSMLHGIQMKEEGDRKKLNNKRAQKTSRTPVRSSFAEQCSSSYSRYQQERFNKENVKTAGFNIDTMRTYHGMTLKSVTELPSKEDQPVPSCSGTSRKNLNATIPIIIIPSVLTSLITMYNVKDLLQDMKFVTEQEKKKLGYGRDNEVILHRPRNGHTIPYRVVDLPTKLKPADWNRVVAVFVLGPTWQFKGFPWKDPVQIFDKIAAFHIKYDEMKIDANVDKWAVTVIPISRTKRHLDKAALMSFWEKLDKYMLKNKPHLIRH